MSSIGWLILFSLVSWSLGDPLAVSVSDEDVLRHWTKVTALYSSYSFPWKDQFAHLIRSAVNDSKEAIGADCLAALDHFADQLDIGTQDALAMADAFSKSLPGHIDGHIINFGHADSCQKVKMKDFRGKHHLLEVQVPGASIEQLKKFFSPDSPHQLLRYPEIYGHRTIWFGVCLPSTCTSNDVDHLLQSPPVTNLTQPVKLKVDLGYVNTNRSYKLTKVACILLIVSVIVVNVIASLNLIDSPLLKPFDVRVNLASLATPTSNKVTQFSPAIKTYYSIGSTYTHLVLPIMFFQSPFTQKIAVRNGAESPLVAFSGQYLVANISFNFVISALLSTWTWLPIMRTRSVPLTMFVIVRVLRTLPVQLFVMAMVILLPEVHPFGTLSDFANRNMSGTCFENGWADLMFISNFRPLYTKCNRVCWFLSAEMQLYCASFFLLLYLSKKTKEGQKVNLKKLFFTLTIVGFIINTLLHEDMTTLTHIIQEPAEFIFGGDGHIDFYMHTFNYVVPYIIGVYVGFELLQGTRIPPKYLAHSFALTFFFAFLSIFVPYKLLTSYYDLFPKAVIVLIVHFQVLTNIISWCLFMVSWASSADHWLVDWVSTNPFTTIMTKLSFSYYLIHPFVLVNLATGLDIIYDSLGHMYFALIPGIFFFSLPLALFVHLCVEVPFGKLLKLALSGTRREKEL